MQIFTTGAYLIPKQIGEQWYWVVKAFEDSAYNEKGDYVSPVDRADTEAGLLNHEDNIE